MRGVIYLDKQSLQYYAEKMTVIPQMSFVPGSIADLEVIDVTKLDQAIKSFIDTNKLLPATLSIVLSPNTLFTKDILDPKAKVTPDPKNPTAVPAVDPKTLPTIDELKQQYIETVPFDEVSYISLPIQHGVKVIAANKTLFTCIKRAFEKYGFSVDGVTPLLTFGNAVMPVDQTIAKRLLAHIDIVKQHNLLTVTPPPQAKKEGFVIAKTADAKEGNKRAYIMLGVFGVLFVIMGVMLYQMLNDPSMKPAPKKKRSPAVTQVSPTAVPVITDAPASSSASLDFSRLSFEIISPVRNSSEAAGLRSALEEANAEDVTVVTRTTSLSRPTVAYSADLNTVDIASLTSFVEEELQNPIIREGEDLSSDVVITLPTP